RVDLLFTIAGIRMKGERQGTDALHELIRCAYEPPGTQREPRLDHGLLKRTGRREQCLLESSVGRHKSHFAVPRSKGQKVPNGDGAFGRDSVVERPIDAPQDSTVLELG